MSRNHALFAFTVPTSLVDAAGAHADSLIECLVYVFCRAVRVKDHGVHAFAETEAIAWLPPAVDRSAGSGSVFVGWSPVRRSTRIIGPRAISL